MATDAPPQYGDTQEYGGGTQEYGGYGGGAAAPAAAEPVPTTASGEQAAAPDSGYSDATGSPAVGAAGGAGAAGGEKASEDDGVDGFFKERRKRILTLSAIFIWFCLLALPRWLDTKDLSDAADDDKASEQLLNVYNTHAAGLFFIFIGIVAALVVQFLEWRDIFTRQWIVDLVLGACIMLGAVLYFIAGIAYSAWVNKWQDGLDEHQSLAGAYFFESVFVSIVAGFLALDVARNILSISQRVRIFFLWGVNMLFCSLLLFFCYAVLSGSEDIKDGDKAGDTNIIPAFGCIAAGWFFCLLANVIYLVTEFAEICCGWNDGAKTGIASFQDLILNVCNALNVFGAFLVFAGYWAFADTVTSDGGGGGGNESDSNFNAYYVGLGFFVLFNAMFMAFDISWGEFIASRYA